LILAHNSLQNQPGLTAKSIMEDSTPKNDTMIKDASVEQIEHYPPDLEQNGKTHGAQNIDSLGYASNAREEDSSDYVSKKTWVVITVLPSRFQRLSF
jgi:hypothetical protein